ncbi:MAG: hypothetical protein H6993_18685 [Pseudomonadales bacterium]|nr:hypothetical protein [Pseudomonadales bacterium]MCP5186000.1 hypothetical protein [Pseudomonadales bacterium]
MRTSHHVVFLPLRFGWRALQRGAGLLTVLMLTGCVAVRVSSEPVYPENWPAWVAASGCPDISGTYHAISDAAAPLIYPPGGHPRMSLLVIPMGPLEPVPSLGRRLLPWHLAGLFSERDTTLFAQLSAFEADVNRFANEEGQDADAWVAVTRTAENELTISTGIGASHGPMFSIHEGRMGWWTYNSRVYQCDHGTLVVTGAFPPPAAENPRGWQDDSVGAHFTFHRAADGSLVALEEAYTGVSGGNMVFNKWWRWQPWPKDAR